MQRDASAIPGWEQRSHIPQGHSAHVPQLERNLRAARREPAHRSEQPACPKWDPMQPKKYRTEFEMQNLSGCFLKLLRLYVKDKLWQLLTT